MNKNKRSPRGFTLVELMIAMLIFVTTAVVVALAFVAAEAMTESSRNLTQAVEDGRSVLERIRDDVQSSADIGAFMAAFPETTYEDWVTDQQENETGFSDLTNEAVDVTYGDPGDDPLSISVAVSWQEHGGRARTTTLETQMTRR
ncbi:MAG: prepilin-type N-terminal cleavage/methylation domain-containing protein [Candidatus Omnitrophica bacterium]|nr:prepilin-type N-terminal cleavage/methylation domain-containing protein [Candidatus Omnitrophota bacterium]